MTKKNEIVKDKKNEVGEVNFEQYNSAGLEDITMKDMAMPYFKLLQKGSPEVLEDEYPEKYIEGAKAGMILNSSNSMIFDELEIVVCRYSRVFTEWIDRDAGGGKVGDYAENDEIVKKARFVKDDKGKKKLITEAGNELVETGIYFVQARVPGTNDWFPGIIPMSSAKWKPARELNGLIRKVIPNSDNKLYPIFAQKFSLSTILEANKKGDKYYNYKVKQIEFNSADIMDKAFNFYKDTQDFEVALPVENETDNLAY